MGEGASEAFEVKIGLRQGSVLSPLVFISVLDLIEQEHGDSGEQFRVHRRGSVRRREDGERGASKSTGRSERVESR